jgi:hypothetical protein
MPALNLWRDRGEGKRRTHGIAERAGALSAARIPAVRLFRSFPR